MIYNVVLVSTEEQSESAICIHISPNPLPLEPPSHLPYSIFLGHHKARSCPVLCSSFPLAIHFTFGSVYMSMLLSHFIPDSPYPHAVKSVLYIRVFILAMQLGSSVSFLNSVYML